MQRFGQIKYCLLYLLLFWWTCLSSQDPYYLNFDTKDGLPSSEVYDVHIDQKGLVWFATDRGVCSYNGYEIEAYTKEEGLSNTSNFTIVEDKENRLWFLGLDRTLSILSDGQFMPYPQNAFLQQELDRSFGIHLLVDKAGTVYVYGFSVNKEKDRFLKLSMKGLPENLSPNLLEQSFPGLSNFPSPRILDFGESCLVLEEDRIFLGELRDPRKQCFYVRDEQLFRKAIKEEGEQIYPIGKHVDDLFLEENGDLWACTSEGLYLFLQGDLEQKPKVYFENLGITDIAKDREGTYWVTTLENGVFYIPSMDIHSFRTSPDRLNTEKILTATPLQDQIVWSTSEGRFFSINKKMELEWLLKDKSNLPIKSAIPTDNEIYYSRGHVISAVKGKLSRRVMKHPRSPVISMLSNGHLINGFYRGINVFEFNGNKHISLGSNIPVLKKVLTIKETVPGTILIGTIEGLFEIEDFEYDKIHRVMPEASVLRERIDDIQMDQHGHLWISTLGKGLLYKTKDTLFQVSRAEGLNNNLVNCSILENDSTLWVGSNKGLNKINYHFEKRQLKINNVEGYFASNGLLSNYVNDLAFWEGNLWLATNQGVNFFKPEDLQKESPEVPVYLEKILVNGEDFPLKNSLQFSHAENDLTFSFIGISNRKEPSLPFYRFRLMGEGRDTTWNYTNSRQVLFNNLSPGHYTFEAAASNQSRKWSSVPIAQTFSIHPHFSDTFWFKGLTGLFLLLALAWFYWWRSQRALKEQKEKQALQDAKLRTKEAELAALRNQMNPHFVFNSLNSIQNFIFKKEVKQANYYLSKFSRLMRDGLHYTRLESISLHQELEFLSNYLDLEKMRFPGVFDYVIKVEEDLALRQYFVPALLFQPILENAVIHAFRNLNYKGLLEVIIRFEAPNLLIVIIRDNGRGMADSNNEKEKEDLQHQSLGLQIIAERIELLNLENRKTLSSFTFSELIPLKDGQTGMEAYFRLPQN